jgi:hypothetical protein
MNPSESIWWSLRTLRFTETETIGILVPQFSEWEAQQGGLSTDGSVHEWVQASTENCNEHTSSVPVQSLGTETEANSEASTTSAASLGKSHPTVTSESSVAPTDKQSPKALWLQLETIREACRSQSSSLLASLAPVDREALQRLAWNGLPGSLRALAWKMLLDYCPSHPSRLLKSVGRKREQYWQAVADLGLVSGSRLDSRLSSEDWVRKRQIDLDVPRTAPEFPLFHTTAMQRTMTRILHLWSVRHPASGYVQGLNDILVPLLYVFFADLTLEVNSLAWTEIPEHALLSLHDAEADAYWCLCALLDALQDQYVFAQPGIQRRVQYLERLLQRIDAPLQAHFLEENVGLMQFAFRWMNCLLVREFPLPVTLRLWDAYLSERGTFASFHVYVCAALLERFSKELMQLSFPELVLFLQNLPTQTWTEQDISMLLSQAYLWKALFSNARRL